MKQYSSENQLMLSAEERICSHPIHLLQREVRLEECILTKQAQRKGKPGFRAWEHPHTFPNISRGKPMNLRTLFRSEDLSSVALSRVAARKSKEGSPQSSQTRSKPPTTETKKY